MIPNSSGWFLILLILQSYAVSPCLLSQEPDNGPLTLEVGGRTLKIPPPAGFVRCDGINSDWDQAMSSVLPVNNRMLASFGTPKDQDLIRQGAATDYERNFNIQSVRSIESVEIGERTFSGMRQEVKKQLQSMRSKLDVEMKKLTDQGNKKFEEAHGVDIALSISDTAVLGFFEETETSIGFTMAMKVGVAKDTGREESHGVVACLMTPVNGRLVNLYSSANYTGEPDRQEVEKTVKAWRDAILAVNPKVAGPAAGFDWEAVQRSALIGAGIGGLIGLVKWLSMKFRRTKSE